MLARQGAQRAKKYVVETRGIQESRIKAIDGGYREELTVILQPVPRGSPRVQPSPNVKPSEVQIIRSVNEVDRNPRKSPVVRNGSSSLLFFELPVICPGNATVHIDGQIE